MKKGELVVKIISIMGTGTATLARIESVKKGVVKIKGAESLSYSAEDGREIDAAIPGCTSYLVELDGGEQASIEAGNIP